MYAGALGDLGKVPPVESMLAANLKHFRWTLEAYAPDRHPFTPEVIARSLAVVNNRNEILNRATEVRRIVAAYVNAPIDDELVRRVAAANNLALNAARDLLKKRRYQISETWALHGLSWETGLAIVSLAVAGGILGAAGAAAGAGTASGAGAASGAAAGSAAGAGATAALAAPSVLGPVVGTLLPEIVITAAPIGFASYAVPAALAVGAGAAAVAPSLAPTLLPEIQITAAPLTFPTEILAPGFVAVPFSQSLPAFEMPAQQPRDFGLPEEAPRTLTEELKNLAKDYAIQYGKDEAIAYVQAELQRKLLAAEEARLRAEMDAMERELRNLAPGAAGGAVQAGMNGDKIAALLALLATAWAFKG